VEQSRTIIVPILGTVVPILGTGVDLYPHRVWGQMHFKKVAESNRKLEGRTELTPPG
jgi:hypothetical protein